MKDPSFPLYARDWLTATRTMTAAARGAYIDLLCHQWLEGPIPPETHRLRRVCAMDQEEFDEVWPEIQPHFQMNCVGLIHPRLEHLRQERESYLEKQRENGMKGGRPKIQTKPTGSVRVNPKKTSASAFAFASSSSSSIALAEKPPIVPKGDFCEFWNHYPKRKGSNPKQTALVAYERALKRGATAEAILAGVKAYSRSDPGERGAEFIAQAVTWLNQRRWEDDYSEIDEKARIIANLRAEGYE